MSLAPGGKIEGISLSSFLQMVQTEKSTCTLLIQNHDQKGTLYIMGGEIIDADYKNLSPVEAVYEILCIVNPVIHMEKDCTRKERQVRLPMMHLLMEGARRFDEKQSREEESEDIDFEDQALAALNAYEFSQEEKNQATRIDSFAEMGPEESTIDKPREVKEIKKEEETKEKEEEEIKEEKVKKKKIWLLPFLAVLLLILAFPLYYVYKKQTHENSYNNLIEALDRTDVPEREENLISRFIENFPESPHVPDLEIRMQRAKKAILDRDFKVLLDEDKKLSLEPENFEQALRIYSRFLASHTSKEHIEIAKKLREERIAVMARYLAAHSTRAGWLNEARDFISRFPDNSGIGILEAGIKEISDQEADEILHLQVENKEERRRLILSIRAFLRNFPAHSEEEKIRLRLETLLHNEAKEELITKVARESSLNRQLYLYEKALREEKDPLIKEFAAQKIEELSFKIEEEQQWKSILGKIQSPAISDASRLAILDHYLTSPLSEEQRRKAEEKRRELARDIEAMQKQASEEQRRREALAAQRRQEEERTRAIIARTRLDRALSEINKKLETLSDKRFNNLGNATVLDNKTKKIWMLTDSEAYTGKALNFNEAKDFIKNLRLGGYSDWRLPTEKELADIFKNPPHYPLEQNKWYWSREVFSHGYQNVVRVVSSKAESSLQQENRRPDEYGHVFAIRP